MTNLKKQKAVVTQPEPILLIKSSELNQLQTYLDTVPHGIAKTIIQFLNNVTAARKQEQLAAEKAKTEKETDE